MSGEISKCPAKDQWFAGQNVRRSSKSFNVLCLYSNSKATLSIFYSQQIPTGILYPVATKLRKGVYEPSGQGEKEVLDSFGPGKNTFFASKTRTQGILDYSPLEGKIKIKVRRLLFCLSNKISACRRIC